MGLDFPQNCFVGGVVNRRKWVVKFSKSAIGDKPVWCQRLKILSRLAPLVSSTVFDDERELIKGRFDSLVYTCT